MQNIDDINKTLIRQIIQQIRTNQIKEPLAEIEKLDKTTLDQTVTTEQNHFDSVLQAAIECDALEVVNKLIEKKCNLQKTHERKDALKLWRNKNNDCETFEELTSAARKIFSALFAAKQPLFENNISEILSGISLPSAIRLPLLREVIGEEALMRYLLSPRSSKDNLVPIVILTLRDFNACLKLFSHMKSISEENMFKLRLASHRLRLNYRKFNSPENSALFSEIDNALLHLSKHIMPKETKSQFEGKILTDLLMPQASPMQDFPNNEYWRLFVDGQKQVLPEEQGWVGYEKREAGCLQAMYDAFLYAREDLTAPLTFEMTDKIHRHVAAHFSDTDKYHFRWSAKSGIHAFDALSYAGFLEIIQPPYNTWYQIERQPGNDFNAYCANFEPDQYQTEEQIIEKVKNIIQEYHDSFANGGTDRVKQLQAIIKLASNYARFHPYVDGNNRTAVCILNRELEKHGFPLTIMSNPNELEGHSQDELFTKVCEGMQNFLRVKNALPYENSKTTEQFIAENGKPPPIQIKSTAKAKPK